MSQAQPPRPPAPPPQPQRAPQNAPQNRQQAAQTPQQDHTPRQEEQYAREQQQQGAAPQGSAPAPDPQVAAALKEAMAAASIGAQVILDYNEKGSLGARGGAGADIVENTMARDEYLVELGLDPVATSGPPPSPEALAARRNGRRRGLRRPEMPRCSHRRRRGCQSLAVGLGSGADYDESAGPRSPGRA